MKAGTVDLATSTGEILINRLECLFTVSIKVSTGDLKITKMKCGSLLTDGSTGDIKLVNTLASERFDIRRSTGDVTFENCDAGELAVKTSTGDVTGSLLSDKIFITKSSTGSIHVPETTSGGICRITTSTGDVKIRVGNKGWTD